MTNYRYDEKPRTVVAAESQIAYDGIKVCDYAVLVGRNNCGKSFLLKQMARELGERASYLGPARYQNFNVLGIYSPRPNKKSEAWRAYVDHYDRQTLNFDNSPMNLQQAIAELNDHSREKLCKVVAHLLGSSLEIPPTIPNNSMSQRYVSYRGHNLSYASSGVRLVVAILTSLLDEDYETYFVDEPELGTSPEAQGVLADFLFDREARREYFAHIKTLVFATHSSVFLDRKLISNNIRVEKIGDEIHLSPVQTVQDFHRIHFFLLGNRLDTLYLPALIVIVEGKTDHAFIQRVLLSAFPNHLISVTQANNDDQIKNMVHTASVLLGGIQRSPYQERMLVVLDSVHASGLRSTIEKIGVPSDAIVVWSQNGIEFLYPEEIMTQIFGDGGEIEVVGDKVSRNGMSLTKTELSEQVLSRFSSTTALLPEMQERLMGKVRSRLGL